MEAIPVLFIMFCVLFTLAVRVHNVFYPGERVSVRTWTLIVWAVLQVSGSAVLISWAVEGIRAVL